MGLFNSKGSGTPAAKEVENVDPKSQDVASDEEKDPGAKVDVKNQTIDPAVERRVIRKLDRNVVPLVFALC